MDTSNLLCGNPCVNDGCSEVATCNETCILDLSTSSTTANDNASCVDETTTHFLTQNFVLVPSSAIIPAPPQPPQGRKVQRNPCGSQSSEFQKSLLNPDVLPKKYQPILPAKVPKNPSQVHLSQSSNLYRIDRNNLCRPFQTIAAKPKKPTVTKIAPAPLKPPPIVPNIQSHLNNSQPHTIVFCPVSQQSGLNLKLTPYKPILPAPSKQNQFSRSPIPIPTTSNQRFVQFDSSSKQAISSNPKAQSQPIKMESDPKPLNTRPTSIVHPFNTSKKPTPIKSKLPKTNDPQKSPSSSIVIPSFAVAPFVDPMAKQPDHEDTHRYESTLQSSAKVLETIDTAMKQEAGSPGHALVTQSSKREISVESSESGDYKLTIDETIEEIEKNSSCIIAAEPSIKTKVVHVPHSDEKESKNRKLAIVGPTVLKHYLNGIWIEETVTDSNQSKSKAERADKEDKASRKRPHANDDQNVSSTSKKKKQRKSSDYVPETKIKTPLKKSFAEKPQVEVQKSNPIHQNLSLDIPGSTILNEVERVSNASSLLQTSSSTSSGVYSASESSASGSHLQNCDSIGQSSGLVSPESVEKANSATSSDLILRQPPPISPIRAPCDKPIMQWSTSDVYNFVRSVPAGSEYADQFKSQDIDGQALSMLKEVHLMSAMKMKLGPALKICSSIRKLKEQGF